MHPLLKNILDPPLVVVIFCFVLFLLLCRKEWKIQKLFDVHPKQAPLSVESVIRGDESTGCSSSRLRGRKCRFWSQFNFNIFPAEASLTVTALSRKVVNTPNIKEQLLPDLSLQ